MYKQVKSAPLGVEFYVSYGDPRQRYIYRRMKHRLFVDVVCVATEWWLKKMKIPRQNYHFFAPGEHAFVRYGAELPSVDEHIAIHIAFEIVGIRQYWILTRAQPEFRFL
jgi:hypothetical protein